MSNGRFARSKYQADDNSIHYCRVQPETMTTTPANSAPTGEINANGQAKVSGSRRTIGLHCRGVILGIEYPVNAPNSQDLVYTKKVFIPILKPETYLADGFKEGRTVAYLGENWKVISQVPEKWN
jgi:hypothetical protein